jgi:hypothetical protein
MKNAARLSFFIFSFLYAHSLFAQCDTIANVCNKHLKGSFISDGQEYRALLIDTEIAEFTSTFYGGSTYRISACSGFADGDLIFRIYDSERHLLFSNANYVNAPYWDFKFTSTLNCTIEAQLSPAKVSAAGGSASGCAVILVGFKSN